MHDARRRQQGLVSSEVFDILDYSIATPWEQVIHQIEEALRAWLADPLAPLSTQIDHDPACTLLLVGDPRSSDFTREMLDPSSDFSASIAFSESSTERLRRWFGLNSFALVMPEDDNGLTASAGEEPGVIDANDMAKLQGALNVALTNCGCSIPAFVLHDVKKGGFRGAALSPSAENGHAMHCRFDSMHYTRGRNRDLTDAHFTPTGICALFRSKLPSDCRDSITLSRRHTYDLNEWPGRWVRPKVGPAHLEMEVGRTSSDPLPSLRLAVQWPPDLADHLEAIRDSGEAPLWTLRAVEAEERGWGNASGPEGSALAARVGGMLTDLATCAAACEAKQYTTSSLLEVLAADGCVPLSAEKVEEALRLLVAPAPELSTSLVRCTYGRLLHRLALSALIHRGSRSRPHGACALLQLWSRLLVEVRRAWELSTQLPHTRSAAPVAGDAPIAQTLQLVAYSLASKQAQKSESEWEERRAAWRAEKKEEAEADAPAAAADGGGRSGARSPLPDLYGLESGEQLWAPHTQPESPQIGLASSHSANADVASIASRLKSNMMAFKAANPGCVISDFVRWYAPSEWVCAAEEEEDDDDKEEEAEDRLVTKRRGSGGIKGHLSERFNDPNDLWRVLWDATQPLAAAKQRPLFDADREATEALDRLESLPPRDLMHDLPLLIAEASLTALAASPWAHLSPNAPDMLKSLDDACRELHGRKALPSEWRTPLLEGIAALEAELLRAASLAAKLGGGETEIIRSVLADQSLQREAEVPRAARRVLERELSRCTRHPDASEYVLRPAAASVAHRMYVAVQGKQWRLAVALSGDAE